MSLLSSRRAAVVVFVTAIMLTSPALASWLQPHTQQEAVPISRVKRPLVTGKSWFVFDLDFRFKQSTSHFLGDTPANVGFEEGTHWERENNDGRWTYRRWELGLTWGFSRQMDIYVRIPVIWGSVYNSRMGEDPHQIAMNPDPDNAMTAGQAMKENTISGVGLGDLTGGFRFQFLRSQSEDGKLGSSLIGQLGLRFPTGSESPGSYIGGPNNVATVITGTGTWGVDLSARFKQQLAIIAVEAGVGFTWNPTGTVMYLLETEENYFNQHLDPGDVVHADVGVSINFFKNLGLGGTFFLDYRTKSRWGSTSNTFPACKECVEIPGSDGLYMDIEANLYADFDIHLGLEAYFRYTLAGRHNFLWPLEDISPARGWTVGANLAYRF